MCSLSPGAAWKMVQEQKDNSQGLVSPLQAGITYFLLKLYGPVSPTQIKPSPRLKSMFNGDIRETGPKFGNFYSPILLSQATLNLSSRWCY
ncbi:hypothetical protein J4Q44_G00207560 [Coregonus suidteri]|uniref:Uncharacterized protein n=1 Tax=Coregonus suidteri TaxID=861788 RepID=A0AAN8LF30_9TELE